MKILIVLLASLILLSGCGATDRFRIVVVEEHEYVVYSGYSKGGITHSASCSKCERDN